MPFRNIYLTVIVYPSCYAWGFLRVPHQNALYISVVLHTCHMPIGSFLILWPKYFVSSTNRDVVRCRCSLVIYVSLTNEISGNR